jgi:hypothetical protein
MRKVEKKPASFFSTPTLTTKPKILIQSTTKNHEHLNDKQNLDNSAVNAIGSILVDSVDNDDDEEWEIAGTNKFKKVQRKKTKLTSPQHIKFSQNTNRDKPSDGVHNYFSFGRAEPNSKPKFKHHNMQERSNTTTNQSPPPLSNDVVHQQIQRSKLPPFKITFENNQQPPEIQVLNELVKYNNRLNVSTAFYSKHINMKHLLLLYANDSSTYEMLCQNNSWPNILCNLSFQVTLPRRFPPSYSILINRIPREWDITTIQPLIADRYTSTDRITRIFRDGQPTTRIRIDFHSQDDVQSILHDGFIYIDSIRYSAIPYKPLLRIERCFQCQQFGHTIHNCINEPKCFKCGLTHPYNPNCLNTITCANCGGLHMAGAPECPVKISFRKEKWQQQQDTKLFNRSATTNYLPSSARLYSNVLQTMSSHINSTIQTPKITRLSASEPPDQSSLIIKTLKDEIGKSQDILLERMIQLEHKCETATQQQLTSQHMITTQILPHLMPMSELIVDIYDTLAKTHFIQLTKQQQAKLSHLRELSNLHQIQSNLSPVNSHTSNSSSPPLLSRTRAQPNLCSTFSSAYDEPPDIQLPQRPFQSNNTTFQS